MNVSDRKQPSSLWKLILGYLAAWSHWNANGFLSVWFFNVNDFSFLSQFLIPFLAFHDAFCVFFSSFFSFLFEPGMPLSAKSTELFSALSNTETDWRADWPPRFKLVFNCWKCALPAHCFCPVNPWIYYILSSNLSLPHKTNFDMMLTIAA